MSPGEIAFLVMVIVAISMFAIAIAYASFVASGSSSSSIQRTPKLRDTRQNASDGAGKQIPTGDIIGASIR